jgi:hypothetical protein
MTYQLFLTLFDSCLESLMLTSISLLALDASDD